MSQILVDALQQFRELRLRAKHTYADKLDAPYVCQEDFVLRHGFVGKPAPFDTKRYRRGKPKECFANAFNLALRNPELIYVEGFALNFIPQLHAWCVDQDGNVVDPTWEDPEKQSFLGVPFSLGYLHERQFETLHYVSVLDNYLERWPLLTGKHSLEEAQHGLDKTLLARFSRLSSV